jgi:hypothetical protein
MPPTDPPKPLIPVTDCRKGLEDRLGLAGLPRRVATSGGAEQADALGPIHFHRAAHDPGEWGVARRRFRGPEFLARGVRRADAGSTQKGRVRPIRGMRWIGHWSRAAGGYLRFPVSAGAAAMDFAGFRYAYGRIRRIHGGECLTMNSIGFRLE